MQDAKGKYDLLTERGIPVWVMEPVRGGRLAKLAENDEVQLKALRPEESIPCTACRYCCDSCPQGLDIPMLLATYNDIRFSPSITAGMRIESLPEDKQPSSCIGCGQCSEMCPQKIDIPQAMRDLAEALTKIPSWAEMCRQREKQRV